MACKCAFSSVWADFNIEMKEEKNILKSFKLKTVKYLRKYFFTSIFNYFNKILHSHAKNNSSNPREHPINVPWNLRTKYKLKNTIFATI